MGRQSWDLDPTPFDHASSHLTPWSWSNPGRMNYRHASTATFHKAFSDGTWKMTHAPTSVYLWGHYIYHFPRHCHRLHMMHMKLAGYNQLKCSTLNICMLTRSGHDQHLCYCSLYEGKNKAQIHQCSFCSHIFRSSYHKAQEKVGLTSYILTPQLQHLGAVDKTWHALIDMILVIIQTYSLKLGGLYSSYSFIHLLSH